MRSGLDRKGVDAVSVHLSTVMKYGFCNECGTYGVGRFYGDGSFRGIIDPCCHKRTKLPTLTEIRRALEKGRREGESA